MFLPWADLAVANCSPICRCRCASSVRKLPRALARELMSCESVHGVTIDRADELSLQVVQAAVLFRQLAMLAASGDFEVKRLETTDVTTEATFGYVMSAAAQF